MRFAAVFLFFVSLNVSAGTSMPSTFTYQGRLMNAAGNAALVGNLTLYIEIKNPSGSCLLYSEHQPVNTTTTSGIFSIQIGAGTRTNAVAGYEDDPGYQFSEIFTNKQDFPAVASCAGGWTPGTTDARMLRIHVYDGSTTTTLADQALSPVPQASVADTIDGVPLQGLTLNWTTATRPVNPVNGMHGYNDTLNRFEKWNGATWVSTTPKFSAAVINDTATDNYVLKWNDGTDTWEPADVMTLLDTPGGDVSGTIANMTVESIQGQGVATTAPNSGEVLKWNGSEWEAAPDTDSGVLVASGSGTQYRVPIFNASGELADSSAYDNGTVFGIQSDLDMNTHKIVNLVDPTAGKDAATKDYVDSAVGGSGQTTIAGGTQDRVTKFNAAGDNVVDSSITDNGSLVTINNPLVSTGSITTDGPMVLKEIADPTQTAGYGKIYVKADNTVWYMDEAGVPQQFVFSASAGEDNTASNVGAGVGVWKDKTGVDLRFKSLTPGASSTIAISADAGGDEIDIDLAQNGAANGQILRWNGANWVPAWNSSMSSADGSVLSALSIDNAGVVSVTNSHTVTAGNDVADKDYVDSAVSTLSAVTDITGGDAVTATETLGTYDIDVNVDNSTIEVNADALRIKDGGVTRAKLAAGSASGDIMKWDGDSWELAPDAGGTTIAGGTQNYVSKFNATGDNVVNSQIFDDGTNVGIGTASPNERLTVSGNMSLAQQGSAPSATADFGKIYVTGDGASQKLFFKNENNDVFDLTLASGGGTVTSLEGATGTVDLQNGSTGTTPNWTQSGSNVTLHVPLASGAGVTSGTISKTDYDRIPASGSTNDTVMRWNGTAWVQTDGIKIESDGDVVLKNAPTANDHVTDKEYVDNAVAAVDIPAVTDGTTAGQTLRWDGDSWEPMSTVFIDGDGEVGIGTNAPNEKLTVEGAVSLREIASASNTTDYGKLYVKSSDNSLYYQDDLGNENAVAMNRAWQAITSNTTAIAGGRYFVDTSGGAITITLPASANMGDTITFIDAAGSFNVNNLTVARNGLKIMGLTEDMTVDTQNISFELIYYNATNGWRLK